MLKVENLVINFLTFSKNKKNTNVFFFPIKFFFFVFTTLKVYVY